nr:hypothetical protein [Tanacetum cinerariifolium]
MILNGISNDIYSIMDACPNAKEIWIAIGRLQQRESINKHDVKTRLFWEFCKFTSRDDESTESYYTSFYQMINEMVRNKLKVDTMQDVAMALAACNPDRNTNGDECHVSGTCARRTERVTRECTYPDFMNNRSVENQIKFSICTLLGSALMWWNSHIITVDPDVAYAMTWESDKIERYVGGLPDVIHRSVVASRPKTMQEAIEMENEQMDKRNNTLAERQAENKRKFDDTSKKQSKPTGTT